MLKVGIYTRVSTDEQVGPEGSIKNQFQRCEAYLKARYGTELPLPYAVLKQYREEGISGKDISNRPQFQEMLSDIQQGTIDAVCVAELSRLSRSVNDLTTILFNFEQHDVTFLCLNPSVDTSTPSGKLVMNVMAAVSYTHLRAHET